MLINPARRLHRRFAPRPNSRRTAADVTRRHCDDGAGTPPVFGTASRDPGLARQCRADQVRDSARATQLPPSSPDRGPNEIRIGMGFDSPARRPARRPLTAPGACSRCSPTPVLWGAAASTARCCAHWRQGRRVRTADHPHPPTQQWCYTLGRAWRRVLTPSPRPPRPSPAPRRRRARIVARHGAAWHGRGLQRH